MKESKSQTINGSVTAIYSGDLELSFVFFLHFAFLRLYEA